MTKRALSLLLCLVMVFSLSIGCMTSANALEKRGRAKPHPSNCLIFYI